MVSCLVTATCDSQTKVSLVTLMQPLRFVLNRNKVNSPGVPTRRKHTDTVDIQYDLKTRRQTLINCYRLKMKRRQRRFGERLWFCRLPESLKVCQHQHNCSCPLGSRGQRDRETDRGTERQTDGQTEGQTALSSRDINVNQRRQHTLELHCAFQCVHMTMQFLIF